MNIGEGHYLCVHTYTQFIHRENTKMYGLTPHTPHTYLHKAQNPSLFINAISAWLGVNSYFFCFQIMNFITKLLHAYNYYLQLSAFPKHLAAAQIMFALNTAHSRGIVSGATEGRRLVLVQMSLSLWAVFLSLYSAVFSWSFAGSRDYGWICSA